MILYHECYSTQSFNSSMPDSGMWDPRIKPHCQQQTVLGFIMKITVIYSHRHRVGILTAVPRSLSLHKIIK